MIKFILYYWRLMRGLPIYPAMAPFNPQVIYNSEIRLTEMILEDTAIVWCPWGPFDGHAVDCGYSADGRLIGIRIWDDVRNRPHLS